jgi:hypothetical protein
MSSPSQVEMFSLRFSNVCYGNGKYMMTRLEGFKHLLGVVQSVNSINNKTNYIDTPMLLEWMERVNIVGNMYNVKKTNREIIQRSPTLLRFLVKHGKLSNVDVLSMMELCTGSSIDQDLSIAANTGKKLVDRWVVGDRGSLIFVGFGVYFLVFFLFATALHHCFLIFGSHGDHCETGWNVCRPLSIDCHGHWSIERFEISERTR